MQKNITGTPIEKELAVVWKLAEGKISPVWSSLPERAMSPSVSLRVTAGVPW